MIRFPTMTALAAALLTGTAGSAQTPPPAATAAPVPARDVTIAVDTRIVCATHQKLKELCAQGRFREDLYYRLSEIVVTIPPLRVREGDAALLAHHFKNKFCAQEGRSALNFAPDAIAAIEAYGWPGNVREMENYIKRAVIMADGNTIVADDLGLPGDGAEEQPINLRQVRDEAEYKAIVKALARVDGTRAGVLPASFARGTRLFTALERREPLLGCSVRLAARRWEVK